MKGICIGLNLCSKTVSWADVPVACFCDSFLLCEPRWIRGKWKFHWNWNAGSVIFRYVSYSYYSNKYYLFHGCKPYVCFVISSFFSTFFLIFLSVCTFLILLFWHFKWGISEGWLMYFHAWPNGFISGIILTTYSAGINNWIYNRNTSDLTSGVLKIMCPIINKYRYGGWAYILYPKYVSCDS